jgi:hypothetical protein
MSKKRKTWLAVLVAVVVIGYFSSDDEHQPPTVTGGPVVGRVVEETSEKPIAGVHVVARWLGSITYSHTVCFHAASAITDANGEYRIPVWQKKHKRGRSDDQRISMAFYAAGYRSNKFLRKTFQRDSLMSITEAVDHRTRSVLPDSVGAGPWKDTLLQESGTDEERLQYISKGLLGCDSEDGSEMNLIPFTKAVFEESKSLVSTKEEKSKVGVLLYHLEALEMGEETALERHLRR